MTFNIGITVEGTDSPVQLDVEGRVYWSKDPAFGEDADGNRGKKQVLLEDFDITRIVEVVTGFERYDLIADDDIVEEVESRLLELGPEGEE